MLEIYMCFNQNLRAEEDVDVEKLDLECQRKRRRTSEYLSQLHKHILNSCQEYPNARNRSKFLDIDLPLLTILLHFLRKCHFLSNSKLHDFLTPLPQILSTALPHINHSL